MAVDTGLTTQGRRLLKLAVRRIVRMPHTFEMSEWLNHDEEIRRRKRDLPGYCGTVGCLAGHVVLAHSLTEAREYATMGGDVDGRAQELLFGTIRYDLDAPNRILFHSGHWPSQFLDRLTRRRTSRGRARVLVDRIEHFLTTGE